MSQFLKTQNNSVVPQPVFEIGPVNLWVSSILVRGLDADIFSIESQEFLVRFCNQT